MTSSIIRFQKKPQINHPLFLLLCSGVSIRRAALNLNVHFSTAYYRFLWMTKLANQKHSQFLASYIKSSSIYLDEMESIEHTKLKPLTLPLLVDEDQKILGISAGSIPAKGHLAEISRKKYGTREDQSTELIQRMLTRLAPNFVPLVVKTDGKNTYTKLIQDRWNTDQVPHEVHIRKKEKDKEQLYLNHLKKRFDPMFAINQRCAKLRSDIKRLVRRSWCTTKKVENLIGHLEIYACYNNNVNIFA